MLRSSALVPRRAIAAFAGVLGTFAPLAPAAAGAECAECLTPALPQSVSFADASMTSSGYLQAAPVLRSHVVAGPPMGGHAYGPLAAPPALRGAVPPRPYPFYEGPRRISGLPAYRPFGLPMLSEVGAAIGAGVGAVGAGIGAGVGVIGAGAGALADDVLLGPVANPICGAPRPTCGPPSCVVPRLNIQPLTACGPVCPPPMPPSCLLPRPACAAPAPICAAPAPICAAPAPICAAPAPICAAPCPPPTCDVELVPQTTTKYARRECVTWKEVECVAYRNCKEEYVEPVCRTECRVVDRGCWKKIWVPKLVSEEYTTTDYVRRCRVRRVPYTYTKQVAERSEKLVPYCATTYVPRSVSACLPEPDCGAPDFTPNYAPSALPPGAPAGSYYGAEAYGDGMQGYDTYGGAMYGEVPGAPTGVPSVEYMSPDGSAPLRPIPEDNFRAPADSNTPGLSPDAEGDRTSLAPQIPTRAAARGWTQQASAARQF